MTHTAVESHSATDPDRARSRRTRRRAARLAGGMLVALAVGALGAAPAADGATPPPTLTGETLVDPAPTVTADCHLDGNSTITVSARGTATGPYPGTFEETATFTVGPHVVSPGAGSGTGPVVDVRATFKITSPQGTVTGSKTFSGPVTDPGTQVAIGDCLRPDVPAHAYEAITRYTVGYEASIKTADGTFSDRGVVPLMYVQDDRDFAGQPILLIFSEDFESKLGTTEPNEPANTPGRATGGGQIAGDVTFGLTAKNDSKGPAGTCNVNDRARNVHINCRDVTAYSQTGNEATFAGSATIDGVPTTYRITVQDNAEPGAGSDRFNITTATGYAASGPLTQGNIQVHR